MTMPINLHPKYITDENGKKISVVLSIKEFEKIIEDYEDLIEISKRKDEKTISHKEVLKELKQDGII